MTGVPSYTTYLAKAEAALSEAQLLLGAGYTDGACSRAYYAMFDAAHAALFSLGIEGVTAPIKSHSILVGRFGQSVVLAGHLPATHGEAINKAQRFREIADYSGDPISLDNAEWVVEQAADFVAAVRKKFG